MMDDEEPIAVSPPPSTLGRGKEMEAPLKRQITELKMDIEDARREAATLRTAQGQTEAALRMSRHTEAAALRAAAFAVERAARLERLLDTARAWALPSRTASDTVALTQVVREIDIEESEAAVAREEEMS